ncbi:MAG: O-antigen ligase family protein [Bacteroidota bacterium]
MKIQIDLNTVLFGLYCLLAFSLPFELILEMWFGIDTIFKPFRIIILAIIGVYALKSLMSGLQLNSNLKTDVFLYLVFVYGLLISLVRLTTEVFNLGLFYNDLFQSGLFLISFFILKSLNFSAKQMIRIFQFFIAGMLLNALFSFYTFAFLGRFGRQTGFMDNPNYMALGLVMVMAYCLLRLNYTQRLLGRVGTYSMLLFSLFVFVTAGSRTGLVSLLIAIIFAFSYSSLKRKMGSLLIGIGLVAFLLPQQLDKLTVGANPLILIKRVNQTLNSDERDVRFIIWEGAMRALEDKGYMGMGIGQFKANFAQYFNDSPHELVIRIVDRGYHLSPHNDYFAIITDYGIPGLVFYLLFLISSIRMLIRNIWYSQNSPEIQFLSQLGLVILACLIVFGLGAENFQNQMYWFFLAFSTKNNYL